MARGDQKYRAQKKKNKKTMVHSSGSIVHDVHNVTLLPRAFHVDEQRSFLQHSLLDASSRMGISPRVQFFLKMEAISQLRKNLSGVVPVEAAKCDTVIQLDASIRYIQRGERR